MLPLSTLRSADARRQQIQNLQKIGFTTRLQREAWGRVEVTAGKPQQRGVQLWDSRIIGAKNRGTAKRRQKFRIAAWRT